MRKKIKLEMFVSVNTTEQATPEDMVRDIIRILAKENYSLEILDFHEVK